MKKIISIALIAVLGVGGYFVFNKGGEMVENTIEQLAQANLNKEYSIEILESHPIVKKASLTLTDYQKTTAKSRLDFIFFDPIEGEERSYQIPLNSVITRGKSENNGTSFGAAHIVTKADLSGFTDLPPFINNDSFVVEHFIGLTGDLREIFKINQINVSQDDETVNFDGLTATVDTQLTDRSKFDLQIDLKHLKVSESNTTVMEVTPFNYQLSVSEAGKYTGTTSPISITSPEFSFNLAAGTHNGTLKKSELLDMYVSNGTSIFSGLSVKNDSLPAEVKLDSLTFEGGVYEQATEKADFRIKIMATPDTESMQALGSPVTVKNISVAYALNNIPNKLITTYMAIEQNGFSIDDDEMPLSEEQVIELMTLLKDSDTEFVLNTNIESEEGNAEANVNASFNDQAKAVSADKLITTIMNDNFMTLLPIISAETKVKIDKPLADISGLSMILPMIPGGIIQLNEAGTEFVLDAQVKTGKVIVNGEEMPIPQ